MLVLYTVRTGLLSAYIVSLCSQGEYILSLISEAMMFCYTWSSVDATTRWFLDWQHYLCSLLLLFRLDVSHCCYSTIPTNNMASINTITNFRLGIMKRDNIIWWWGVGEYRGRYMSRTQRQQWRLSRGRGTMQESDCKSWSDDEDDMDEGYNSAQPRLYAVQYKHHRKSNDFVSGTSRVVVCHMNRDEFLF